MPNNNAVTIERCGNTSTHVAQLNPMQLMQIAVESNADLDKSATTLQEKRWEAGAAKKFTILQWLTSKKVSHY